MNEPWNIAVVGMGVVFPEAFSLKQFWSNIIQKRSCISEIDRNRVDIPLYHLLSSKPLPDRSLHRRAGLVRGYSFNPHKFDLHLSSEFLEQCDFLHQWVVDAGAQAMHQCRTAEINPDRMACILAAIALPTENASSVARRVFGKLIENRLFGRSRPRTPYRPPKMDLYTGINSRVTSMPAAVCARALGITGGSYTLDAACASSLYAFILGCNMLAEKKTDLVLAGGVSRPDPVYTQVGFSQLRALSPSGRCSPFDACADGLIVGEGAGMLALKRLDDALEQGDTIYAVIRAGGLSNDTRGNLLAPESQGQLRAMKMAYTQAAWSPSDVQYIECHGTGTPVGDTVEAGSLVKLWKNSDAGPGRCRIGSVKSMIGHLLTAAGAAGMIKTILSLHHRILPPSINFKNFASDSPLKGSPFSLQTEPEPWPEGKSARFRAAVSAFGFGGINAHLLVEGIVKDRPKTKRSAKTGAHLVQWADSNTVSPSAPPGIKLAVVGMSVCLAGHSDMNEFGQALFRRHDHKSKPNSERMKAAKQASGILPQAAMDSVDIEAGKFSIPPNEIEDILPQQLLMLKVAAQAMEDAGLKTNTPRNDMGAVIGISFDFEATNFHLRWSLPMMVMQWVKNHGLKLSRDQENQIVDQLLKKIGQPLNSTRTLGALGGIVASRVARQFKFGGPSFVVSAEEASGLRGLEIAALFLENRIVKTMLVGAVDLFCDPRNLAGLAPRTTFSPTGRSRPFDLSAEGVSASEGAVALIVKPLEDALENGDRIYSVIYGIGSAAGPGIQKAGAATDTYLRSLEKCFANAAIEPSDIGLLECHGSGRLHEDSYEAKALNTFFAAHDTGLPIAIASAKAAFGHQGAASGLVSVVKASLCLYHRILPALTDYSQPAAPGFDADRFHLPRFASFWPRNSQDRPRMACVASMTSDANCIHLVLGQAPDSQPVAESPLRNLRQPEPGLDAPLLLIFRAENRPELIRRINTFRQQIASRGLAGWFSENGSLLSGKGIGKGPASIALILRGSPGLLKVIDQAVYALQNSPNHDFETDPGLFCFFEDRQLSAGKLAFVYPGSGNHYLSMARRIGLYWPEVLSRMEAETERFADQLLPEIYVPWDIRWDDDWRGRARQRLASDPLHMIFGQVLFGGIITRLLLETGLRPQAVIPYSLGESAGLFAMGAWPDRGTMLQRLADSNLFKTELYGPCNAVRRAWKIDNDITVDWCAAHVMCPAAEADLVLASEPHARRLIVNSPEECVIGGLESAVKRVVRKLDVESFFLEGVVAVHCDAALPVARAYKDLHRFPTRKVSGIDFYSCAWARCYELDSESAAESILRQAIDGFDFTSIISQAYKDGVRLFVEIGPGNSCSRMIKQILKDKPCLAVSANCRHQDEIETLLKCAGTMAAAGLDLDLSLLQPRTTRKTATTFGGTTEGKRIVSVKVGQLNNLSIPPIDSLAPFPELHPENDTETAADAVPSANEDFTRQEGTPEVVPHNECALDLLQDFSRSTAATAEAHKQFLQFSARISTAIARAAASASGTESRPMSAAGNFQGKDCVQVIYNRDMCLEFATGSVARVLGPEFAVVDTYPVRVRLPAEPLMLVDRILEVKGEKLSLSAGMVVTEHDVLADAWYLDGGRAPVCISVEAGQADLFLCSFLGIDHRVKGKRAYRLLDARISFHRGLPLPGETIRYHIDIDKFVRQGETWLFFFRFKGFIGAEPFITMSDGCAGFFTPDEVRASGGIILTEEEKQSSPGRTTAGFRPLVDMQPEAYSDRQVDALRRGDLGACFGNLFKGIRLRNALVLPSGRLKLIDRVLELDPAGGRYSLGSIRAEADIHPDDWFLTCHFPDDMVMPGTLMYECCAHTLRIFLLRLGWVTNNPHLALEPLHETAAVLKCRGPVTPETSKVHYQVEIKEIGYNPEPYVIADAHMYADGHHIVYFEDMSLKLSGSSRQDVENFWGKGSRPATVTRPESTGLPLYDHHQILEFAVGSPSKAFGTPYEVFDSQRTIARLPGPPYCFIHRILETEPQPWELKPGGWITAQYDMAPGDWYFIADRSGFMPYCVLLEIALQPCGWLAAYLGSALHSEKDLKFRNLGGKARLYAPLAPADLTLTMRSRLTKVNKAADMIIEHFDFQILSGNSQIFTGSTYFGFFTAQALANQVGLRQVDPSKFQPSGTDSVSGAEKFVLDPPFDPEQCSGLHISTDQWDMPSTALLMIHRLEAYVQNGGPAGLGYLRASKQVDPGEWFFKAHFFQDPVCPGSLGIEAFIQLIKYWIKDNWPRLDRTHRPCLVTGRDHHWSYRGQIIPTNAKVTVEAVITSIEPGEEPSVFADGWLQVDGRYIYEMKSFGIKMLAS